MIDHVKLPMLIASVLLALLAFTATPAAANEEFPACSQQTEGITHCSGNRNCVCSFMPENKGRGLPARFAWDCGILRPSCGEELDPGSTTYEGPMPSEVIVDTRRGRKGAYD